MGAVYKAKDLTLERYVAIKMLRISGAQQPLILSEAKTISQLNHPNIVTVYDIARDGEANFIVMEWVDGRPLNSVIPPQGLDFTAVLTYAQQMVAALTCAHQQGIIHRDIKPQNIMVDGAGRIKVLDFGIAALIEAPADDNDSKQTNDGDNAKANDSNASVHVNAGSPQYMSPEQIQGNPCDARSDLFSLGIVLYEMLTGVKPFLGLNVKQIGAAITAGDYTPLAEVFSERNADSYVKKNIEKSAGNSNKDKQACPTELIAVVDQVLQVEPDARYQSAEQLAQALNAIDEKIKQKQSWWQQQHWLTKALIILPLITVLGWSIRGVLFPPSTQDLIARQLLESKKIAFLPFDNISGDPVLQIFSDGIATMLSSDLAEVGYQQGDGTTWVLPTSEIRQMEDPSVSGIYNKYGVDVIVTGTIQHMGSTRSLHLTLVNGADGRVLKSKQLTLDASKLFEAQTDIRQQVMELLGWKIPDSLAHKFAAKKPALDGAYKHYLQGQGFIYRFDHGDNINNALNAFQTSINLDPDYGDAYVGMAQVQLRQFIESKDVRLLLLMIQTVSKLQQVNSQHRLFSYLQGELALKQGEYQQAAQLFKQSIKLSPNFVKAYTSLSLAYLELNLLKKAEQILQTASQLMPNNSIVIAELGIFYYSNGDYHRAIDYFKKLSRQAPNNYIAYLNISACHYLNGDIKGAIGAAKQSLKIESSADGFSNLGTYYFILKNYSQAVEAYEQMITLNDSDYINWGNLADAYSFANNPKYNSAFEQAISLAEQALKFNPNNKMAISSLAYYYANIENRNKTTFYAKQITDMDSGEDLFFIAAAYARLGMTQAALLHLEFAINNNYSIAEIASSPLFNALKNNMKFRRLLNVTEK